MSALELPEHVTRALKEEAAKAAGPCHRSFFALLTPQQMRLEDAIKQSGGILPPDRSPDEMVTVPGVQAGQQPCTREKCRMWDHKKQQCLDRLMAIKVVYGKADFDGADAPQEEVPGA